MKKEVLLVEDNPDDVKLTMRAFLRNNIANRINVVADGVEALDFLFSRGAHADRQGKPLPTLVLLDLKLPRIDGLEVLRAVRGDPRTRLLPIVVLTSSQEEEDLISSYALGANSYVRKPVDFGAFMEAVKTLGLYWLVLNQMPPVRAS